MRFELSALRLVCIARQLELQESNLVDSILGQDIAHWQALCFACLSVVALVLFAVAIQVVVGVPVVLVAVDELVLGRCVRP